MGVVLRRTDLIIGKPARLHVAWEQQLGFQYHVSYLVSVVVSIQAISASFHSSESHTRTVVNASFYSITSSSSYCSQKLSINIEFNVVLLPQFCHAVSLHFQVPLSPGIIIKMLAPLSVN